MTSGNLQEFSKIVATTFKDLRDVENRMQYARKIAEHYEFSTPEMVLMVTHPDLLRAPVRERCKALGITEEQYALASTEDGFRRFIADYESAMVTTLKLQAVGSTSAAMTEPRYKTEKGGIINDDFSLETEVLRIIAAERKPGTQVNIQNNVWDQARKLR